MARPRTRLKMTLEHRGDRLIVLVDRPMASWLESKLANKARVTLETNCADRSKIYSGPFSIDGYEAIEKMIEENDRYWDGVLGDTEASEGTRLAIRAQTRLEDAQLVADCLVPMISNQLRMIVREEIEAILNPST